MAGTDIQALLSKQSTLNEGVAKLAKLQKESAYHAKQAARKTAEAAELAKANETLAAELAAVTGNQQAGEKKGEEKKK